MKQFFLMFLLISSLMAMGCATNHNIISYGDVSALKKGMSVEDSLNTFNIKKAKWRKNLIIVPLDEQTVVYSYALAMGSYYSTYFLAFKNKQLLFWGYPHEFARSENEELNSIGKRALAQLQAQSAKK